MAVGTPRRAAVFIDKDGTLVHDVPYNVNPALIQLSPGAERLRYLVRAGYRLVVVSNQSGVARGYFPEDRLAKVEARLRELLRELGAPLAGFYYCPHHPHGTVEAYARPCECRKPRPGMFQLAAAQLDLDLSASWMVGDILDDVEAGHAAGCRTVLIDNGNETEWILRPERTPAYRVPSLSEAVEAILADATVRPPAVHLS